MTKEEVRRYIELHGDARKVIDTIKEMQAEGINVTEDALDERLMNVDGPDDEYEEYEMENSTTNPRFIKVFAIAISISAGISAASFLILRFLL